MWEGWKRVELRPEMREVERVRKWWGSGAGWEGVAARVRGAREVELEGMGRDVEL